MTCTWLWSCQKYVLRSFSSIWILNKTFLLWEVFWSFPIRIEKMDMYQQWTRIFFSNIGNMYHISINLICTITYHHVMKVKLYISVITEMSHAIEGYYFCDAKIIMSFEVFRCCYVMYKQYLWQSIKITFAVVECVKHKKKFLLFINLHYSFPL